LGELKRKGQLSLLD